MTLMNPKRRFKIGGKTCNICQRCKKPFIVHDTRGNPTHCDPCKTEHIKEKNYNMYWTKLKWERLDQQ
jgi:hypothetical protein